MHLAFLDEFGHIGPYISRNHSAHNASPVFGLAGYILPHDKARQFATWFFKLKSHLLEAELRQSQKHPATWEKKGTELFNTRNIKKYPHIKEGAIRTINKIYKLEGKLFYYGRQKYQSPENSHPGGLYTTVLGHSIRQLDKYCSLNKSSFLMILDQHSDRIKLLEVSAKTMFGNEPARCLIEPPFHVESHLYQTIQAADWVATLIARLLAYRLSPAEYPDWEWAERIFGDLIDNRTTHSILYKPKEAQGRLPLGKN
ncbi:DUF3800 domain-containing protein [Acidiphilium iwatense]|uniref:DUF3800 domain-containing protein n=1 Tax=Acidiphilium iwatense TaxID=768198 RepID=A0ABS9DXK3_9PROT|nr:DUF3800 domain-containing protein [Acidiphilium iwatense]MCF3947460.1 DUF3800 domain-containing protein [Acidiphilium iwatense]